jgi:hypothetical protein
MAAPPMTRAQEPAHRWWAGTDGDQQQAEQDRHFTGAERANALGRRGDGGQ